MSFQIAHNGVSTGRAYEYGGIFPLFGLLAGAAKAFLPTIAATVIPSLGQAIAGRVTAAIAGPAAAAELSTERFEDEEFEFMDRDTDELDAILAELEELEMGPAPAPARFTTVLSKLQPVSALEVSPSARLAGWRF